MSLLWRSRKQRLGLCSDRLYLSKNKYVAVPPTADAAEWRAAVEALPEILNSMKHQEVSLVIADQFVRYVLLPWNAALKTADQWMALARHRFAAIHGAAAAGWEVKLTETAPQGPRLACAVDRELIEALAAKFVAAGVRLASVQPFLVAGFNRIRAHIGNGSCWLVVEEPGRLTLAFIQRGTWVAIRSRRVDERWRTLLPEIIERESAFLALSAPCTRVIVCAQAAFDTAPYEAWHTQAVSYRELALAWE
ncbi:MAG TPA: hypothetical protein VFZ81_06185 [Burkholderiales bacterium]